MEKERRLSGSRVVHLVRRSSDRHPTGGLKLGRCIDTFVFEIVKNSSAESAGLLVGDIVIEVNGVPCRKVKLTDLEKIIIARLEGGGASLKVKSDQRIVPNTKERGCTIRNYQHPHPEPRKDVRGRRARRNLFPTVHSNQRKDSLCPIKYFALDTPRKGKDVEKSETDGHAEPQAVDPTPCKDAATNTEYVSSYIMTARLYRDWLETQKKMDVRERGSFAQNVKIYNCMSYKKENQHDEEKDVKGSKLKNNNAETPELEREEKKLTESTKRKKALGAVLNSVGRLLSPRKGSRSVAEETENTPIISGPRRSSNQPS